METEKKEKSQDIDIEEDSQDEPNTSDLRKGVEK